MNNRIDIDFDKRPAEPFMVPDGYFDTLTDRIMQNVPEAESSRRFILHPMRWAAVAACVAVMWSAYVYVDGMSAVEADTVLIADTESDVEEDYSYAIIGNGDILTYLDENY